MDKYAKESKIDLDELKKDIPEHYDVSEIRMESKFGLFEKNEKIHDESSSETGEPFDHEVPMNSNNKG